MRSPVRIWLAAPNMNFPSSCSDTHCLGSFLLHFFDVCGIFIAHALFERSKLNWGSPRTFLFFVQVKRGFGILPNPASTALRKIVIFICKTIPMSIKNRTCVSTAFGEENTQVIKSASWHGLELYLFNYIAKIYLHHSGSESL